MKAAAALKNGAYPMDTPHFSVLQFSVFK